MNFLGVLLWGFAVFGVLLSLYGVHRLCLWLEERGWLYYWRKRPSGSAAGCFVALQRHLEPQAQHHITITDQKRSERPTDGASDGVPSSPIT